MPKKPNDETIDPPVDEPVITGDKSKAAPKAGDSGEKLQQEIERIQGRIDEIADHISEGIEGNKSWTLEQLTILNQELANLKANSTTGIENLSSQVTEMREELSTLRSRVQQQEITPEPSLTAPPQTPPSGEDGLPAPEKTPDQPKKKSKTVV